MSKKKKAAVAAPQQNEETLIQADPTAEEILSTLDTPPAPGQAEIPADLPPAPLQAQQLTWENLSADQQAAIVQVQKIAQTPRRTAQQLTWENLSPDQQEAITRATAILAPVEAVLNDESAAKVFAQVGSTAVERLRKLRDEASRARLIKKAGGKDASIRVQEMETAQQDLLEKRAAQILAANGKDKTVAIKMKPSQAWEQACAEQGKVTATFVAFEKRGAADRILQAAGLGNNFQPALPPAE